MELRQESLFADETKGGIEVIYSKFIDQRRMDYKALFGGFDHLRVITFSYGLGFVQAAAAKSGRVFIYPYVIDTLEAARELWPDLPSRSMDSLRGILGIERMDAHRALADCYDELAVLNAELSVIMQSYARKMDYCRRVLLRIAGEIAEEIGE